MHPLLADSYERRCAGQLGSHQDIKTHLPTLSRYASACQVVVEFGVRTGNSTTALLHGLEQAAEPAQLFSYDLERPSFDAPPLENVQWRFQQADTAALATIPECDLLFVDTLHTAAQVKAELTHARSVRHWIILHDTITWGSTGERGQPGITDPIYQFLAGHANEWCVHAHWPDCNGLLCLRRRTPVPITKPHANQFLFQNE